MNDVLTAYLSRFTFSDMLAELYDGSVGQLDIVQWLMFVWHGDDALLCHVQEYGTAVCAHAASTAYALLALLNMLD